MSSYAQYEAEDGRLVILKELTRQTDGRLNETIMMRVLDAFGHRWSREKVRTEMRKLEEIGAVQLAEAGTILIASITRAGLDHVERRSVIEGVARPSPEV